MPRFKCLGWQCKSSVGNDLPKSHARLVGRFRTASHNTNYQHNHLDILRPQKFVVLRCFLERSADDRFFRVHRQRLTSSRTLNSQVHSIPPLREMQLTFGKGRWLAGRWGQALLGERGAGTRLEATFSNNEVNDGLHGTTCFQTC